MYDFVMGRLLNVWFLTISLEIVQLVVHLLDGGTN